MKEKLKALWARIEAKLIDDWRQAYKFGSTRCAVLLLALNWAHENFDVVQGLFPPGWLPIVNKVLVVGVICFRLTKQKGLQKEKEA